MKLKIKPCLIYGIAEKKEATSWRNVGIQSEEGLKKETERIIEELKSLTSAAEFPIEMLPLSPVRTVEEASRIMDDTSSDVLLIYPSGGEYDYKALASKASYVENFLAGLLSPLKPLIFSSKPCLMFLRHDSGVFSLGTIVAYPNFLHKIGLTSTQSWIGNEDVVIDDYGEILWKLRALYGLKNILGTIHQRSEMR